jgi:putative ABC transport system permease protein
LNVELPKSPLAFLAYNFQHKQKTMLQNYFRVALRYLRKDKLYTFINLAGLSIGIACCVIIFLFVQSEINYDRLHKNSDNIYRLTTIETNEAGTRQMAHSYIPMAPLIQSQFADVQEVVRVFPYSASVSNKERKLSFQEEQFLFVDSNFLRVFSFELIKGNLQTALSSPDDLLVTQAVAQRYFADADPVGKQLMIANNSFKIAGILKDPPANSSLQFQMLASFSAAGKVLGPWILNPEQTWYHPPLYSFIQINKAAADKLQLQMNSFEKKFLRKDIAKNRTHQLQPLSEIHFSSLENEMHPSTNKQTVYIFIAIAVLILVIAAVNFINLFLSRILQRLRGVGVRKVLGATNRNIWWQTAAESGSFLFFALILSLIWVTIFLPKFNEAMDMKLTAFTGNSLFVWLITMTLIIILSLLIALLPSHLLSRFRIVSILKGDNTSLFPRKRTFSLQSSFVIFQFMIAIILVASTIIIRSQLNFIQTADIGLQKKQTLVIPIRDEVIQNDFVAMKNRLSQVAGVLNVSAISNFPWAKGFYDFNTAINNNGKLIESNAFTLLVEEDFISTMGMKMAEGRSFSKDYGSDGATAFIINETAAKKFGITSSAGVKLTMNDVASGKPKKGELIGIVKDFHLQSLHHIVDPLILTVSPEPYYLDNIVLKVSPNAIRATLKNIEASVKNISPDTPFDYFFLDDAFEKLYRREMRLGTVFNYFSVLAIIISCLGLFGIAAFTSVQRSKEIGIRKVLGATVLNIATMISKDFIKLVLLAAIIAVPIAWWGMNKWLEDFAYRITISWWVFIIAGFIALMIALFTVSFQAVKAAVANPVKNLRTE